MSASKVRSSSRKIQSNQRYFKFRIATVVLFLCIGFSTAVIIAWIDKNSITSSIFFYLNLSQQNPPLWLEIPSVSSGYYLLLPTLFFFLVTQIVMKITPSYRLWSRIIVISILLALSTRYILWRSLSTLNLSDPLNGIFSIGLFVGEILLASSNIIQFYLMLKIDPKNQEADVRQRAVFEGKYQPNVDILIPTYNESINILERTIIGCQALDYTKKNIYLLDDGQRQEMAILASKLGCEYITRPENINAKAGNLNHALPRTNGELIVVFDADFVPTKNFLQRTVGLFQDHRVALVQTPQSFYNTDSVARNLGLENQITSEEEVFYRHLQLIKDGVGSLVCAGTSFLVRRSAIEKIGGFVTDSLTEDYFTGICLSAQGYRLVYLDEKLSAGLAAETIAAHIAQRLRWARGTLQAFFISSNPLTIPGLTLLQRVGHLEGLLSWFTSIASLIFLLTPLASSFLKVVPLLMTGQEWLYFFLPYYFLQLSTFPWLNRHSRSSLISGIYSITYCFPFAFTVIKTMISPFAKGFRVTPKGVNNNNFVFNWQLALPLIITFILMLASLVQNIHWVIMSERELLSVVGDISMIPGLRMAWIWSAYNLFLIAIALLILLDAPHTESNPSFNLQRIVKLQFKDAVFWGISNKISEDGIEIKSNKPLPTSITQNNLPVNLELIEENLSLTGTITSICEQDKCTLIKVSFIHLSLQHKRQLVEFLFCRPGQWQSLQAPGELQSLWLIFKAILRPKFLRLGKR